MRSFVAPHNGRQAATIANAEAGTEYNPEIRQKRGEAAGSRKRERDLGSWYRQLAADYGNAGNQSAAALQSIENTTTQQLGEAGQRSSADQQRLAAEDQQFAQLVGGPKDTGGLSKIAQAGAAAQRAQVAMSLPVEQQQAAYIGNLGEQKAAARLQGIQSRTEERNRREKIRSDLTAAQHDKGAARTAALEKIREGDRAYIAELKKAALQRREARAAERQAAADAALARAKQAEDARYNAISAQQSQERIGIERTNARTSRRSQRTTARHYAHENQGGLTPAERNSRAEHRRDAMSTAKTLLQSEAPPKNKAEWAQFQAHLIETMGASYSAEIAKAVAKLRKRLERRDSFAGQAPAWVAK